MAHERGSEYGFKRAKTHVQIALADQILLFIPKPGAHRHQCGFAVREEPDYLDLTLDLTAPR